MINSEANRFDFLIGEKVCLRPLQEEDADGAYPGWLNDAEVSAGNSHHVFPYTRSQALEFIRSQSGRRDSLVLAVVERLNGVHIGNISLQNLNFINRSGELAILLGEKKFWGQGLGFEASRLLVRHGFEALNLNRIELGTPASNIGMQKIAEKLGMKREGVKRAAFFKDGLFQDIWIFGLLADEAESCRKSTGVESGSGHS